MSVMSKLIFRADDNTPPDEKRLARAAHSAARQLQDHAWRVLNCLRGKQLREFVAGMEITPEPSRELIAKIREELIEKYLQLPNLPRDSLHLEKRAAQVRDFIAEPKNCHCFFQRSGWLWENANCQRVTKSIS